LDGAWTAFILTDILKQLPTTLMKMSTRATYKISKKNTKLLNDAYYFMLKEVIAAIGV
jgi:hypothetical protein